MNNITTTSSINFPLINQIINHYVSIPFLFFGIIGNILNLLIFTRKTFHNNICVAYFRASTIFDSLVIIVGLLPRLFNGFGIDPTQYSTVLCRIRFFLTYFGGYTAAWFISLACVERYLSSSRSIYKRQLITMKRAYLSMICVILLGFVAFGEQFYCIDINQNLLGAPQSCYQLKVNIHCQIADSLTQFIFEILMPAIFMVTFGLLTLRNVHQTQNRISAIRTSHIPASQQLTNIRNNTSFSVEVNRTVQKRDSQLITMLLIQVAVFVISTLPISIYKIYGIATIYSTKSTLRKSWENTIFNICVISLFINNSVTFYVYTLTGRVFRKELMKLFRLA
ncbi:unnamed protein product [Adineta steineri]|uniref:G-protein coupled receptors family 1 profile domain-containing protein n=1 Tax=Adineta steineri TaxID=433720 RepID=A0A814HEU8_9BILA|nr:unnamed protein product [Adineta steineri]CAF3905300.1 unnamed protein product [Adineta steineri]